MKKNELTPKEITLRFNGKDFTYPNDQKIINHYLNTYLFYSAIENRDNFLRDINKNGPSNTEEAKNNILRILHIDQSTLTQNKLIEIKKLLIKSLHVYFCNKYNINFNTISYNITSKDQNPTLLPKSAGAVCHHLRYVDDITLDESIRNSSITSYMIFDIDTLSHTNFSQNIFSYCHEFKHNLQNLENSHEEFDKKFYYLETKKYNKKTWAASPGEIEADSFAYKNLFAFLHEASKSGKTFGFIKNKKRVFRDFVKSNLDHTISKITYGTESLFKKIKKQFVLKEYNQEILKDYKTSNSSSNNEELED